MAYPKIFAIRYLVALGLCWGLLTASVQASDPLGDEPGDQYLLGMLFQGEDGAGQARHKAIHWYRQAVQRGNPRMQYAVAMWLVRRTSNPATLTPAALDSLPSLDVCGPLRWPRPSSSTPTG